MCGPKDEIKRLMRAGHFKEFIDEPQIMNKEEWPCQSNPEKIRKVLTIIGGSHLAGESSSVHYKYAKEAKTPPQIQVHRTEEWHTKFTWQELEDIIFTKADTRWVHHPHADALVITTRVTNSNVHRLMADDGNAMDILYLDAYKRIGLTETTLSHAASPLYRFIGDHVIPKRTSKLVVTVGERPWVSIVIVDFLVVDYPSAINGIIGRPLLKALKAVT